MVDVLIIGAGPAGAMAALVLARAGARVLVVERARRPHMRVCAGVVHAPARALMAGLGVDVGAGAATGVALTGLLVTGPAGARLTMPYDRGNAPHAVDRRDLDTAILAAALLAGAHVEHGAEAVEPLYMSHAGHRIVRGARLTLASGRALRVPAGITIVADGSQSRLARALGLVRPVPSVLRWAVVGVLDGLEGLQSRAELHCRAGGTFSVTPVGSGCARVCWVVAAATAPTIGQLDETLRRDPWLRERAGRARWVASSEASRVAAVEARAVGVEGLLLAGDAAVPAEPLLADGLHAAMRGGVLAGEEAVNELAEPTGLAHRRLQWRRARELARPWPTARIAWAIVTSPGALTAAAAGARLAPNLAHRLVRRWATLGEATGAPRRRVPFGGA